MADFYTRMQQVAQRLIEAKGRAITLIQRSQQLQDSTKPWRGATIPGDGIQVNVVAVEDRSLLENLPPTDLTRRATVAFVVAYLSAGIDLTTFSQINDNGVLYEILEFKSVSPGPVVVLYEIFAKK